MTHGGEGQTETKALTKQGFSVVNPAAFREDCRDERHALLCMLACDAVVLPSGWERVTSHTLLAVVASRVGIPLLLYPILTPIPTATLTAKVALLTR